MIIELILFCITTILAFVLFKLLTVDRLYYERKGVKSKPQSFGLGNLLFGFLLGQLTAAEFSKRLYDAFENEGIYGIIDFGQPQYIVRDPEILKKLTIKDFDYFEDHLGFVDENVDKLWGNSLFLMQGHKWRQMRATLSPAFTGSKMRQMFDLVSECAVDAVRYLMCRHENDEILDLEMKDFFTRYTNDVIASCAFGLKIDSLTEPNNDFYTEGKSLANFTGLLQIVKMLLFMVMPKLAGFFRIQLTNTTGFKRLVLKTMAMRKKKNIFRPDMINIMMQVRDGNLKSRIEDDTNEEGFATVTESDVGKVNVNRFWNDDEIVAQCFLFFVAGFETTANMLSFTAHELITNPIIQRKLHEEIRKTNEKLNGQRIDYDTLQRMKYLDQVVSEVLRKWPPLALPNRICTKDYVFNDGDREFVVEKGSGFLFPIYSLHHDPQYYPDPEVFDPERFSDENKCKIFPGSYLPFGIGPRNCIGSRFALMEIKAILYYLVLNFSLEINEKTEVPLKLKKTPIFLSTRNGMHLQLKLREKEKLFSNSLNE